MCIHILTKLGLKGKNREGIDWSTMAVSIPMVEGGKGSPLRIPHACIPYTYMEGGGNTTLPS